MGLVTLTMPIWGSFVIPRLILDMASLYKISVRNLLTSRCLCLFLVYLPYYGRPMEYGRPLYFCPVVSFFFFFFFFFIPRLISAAADWMSTILLHMVWPYCEFRMLVWNVLHAARWKCRTPKKRQKIRHLGTITQLCPAISSQLRRLSRIEKTC